MARLRGIKARAATVRIVLALAVLVLFANHASAAQADNPLIRRWVGTHKRRPLWLEFYGDSMLIVNDFHVLDYSVAGDSIVAIGDTSFTVRYWFALGWLLLRTAQGNVITMSAQSVLARPITGRWIGTPSGRDEGEIELQILRNGAARWRWVRDTRWTEGEWDRASRRLTFTWLPDSGTWIGQYEPGGNALLFEKTFPGWIVLILRRFFRR